MEVILADKNGKEIRSLLEAEVDVENYKTNDFELAISLEEWKEDIVYGGRIYIENTEIGGIIRKIKSSTKEKNIYAYGSTFRGMLLKKIIAPAQGEDFRIVNGELNEVLRELIEDCNLSSLFSVPSIDTEVNINFQFERYCTLLSGVEKMLSSVGYRLDIKYIKNNAEAYVRLQAVPQIDYSGRKEFSQDGGLNFTATNDKGGVNHLICLGKGELKDRIVKHLYVQKNGTIGEEQYDGGLNFTATNDKGGVNHLICLGKGELKDRIVKHLYVQKNGTIGEEQYYTGIEEITETYDYSSAEEPELVEKGTEQLKELMNSKKFEVDIEENIETDMQIGDIVGGRDYITGITVKKPIVGKIYTYKNGAEKIEYKIKGDD